MSRRRRIGVELGLAHGAEPAVKLAGLRMLFDEESRTVLYTRAIDGSDVEFCMAVATLFNNGIGLTKDEKRAAALYDKACARGSAEGCYRLGSMFKYGQGVTRDGTRAETLFSQACKGGNSAGCIALQMLREETLQ